VGTHLPIVSGNETEEQTTLKIQYGNSSPQNESLSYIEALFVSGKRGITLSRRSSIKPPIKTVNGRHADVSPRGLLSRALKIGMQSR
jgi:hypothetical protein